MEFQWLYLRNYPYPYIGKAKIHLVVEHLFENCKQTAEKNVNKFSNARLIWNYFSFQSAINITNQVEKAHFKDRILLFSVIHFTLYIFNSYFISLLTMLTLKLSDSSSWFHIFLAIFVENMKLPTCSSRSALGTSTEIMSPVKLRLYLKKK